MRWYQNIGEEDDVMTEAAMAYALLLDRSLYSRWALESGYRSYIVFTGLITNWLI